jgi:hypothetical protein
MALLITGTNFSISAGIGFIALFGICILEGVLLITAFKRNLDLIRHSESPLYTSIKLGVNELIRPVMMTALMATHRIAACGDFYRYWFRKFPPAGPCSHRRTDLRDDLLFADLSAGLLPVLPEGRYAAPERRG